MSNLDTKYKSCIQAGLVYAIIPARSGSKGVKNKNLRCLKGFPLIAYSITAAKLSPDISRVLVTTDSPYYAEVAMYYGAETPFLRPASISGDTSTDIEFMQHAISWLAENEKLLPEFFVHLRPTYPLREIHVVSDAIQTMQADSTATSLRSAHLASNTPYKWFNKKEDGYYTSILSHLTLDEANNPRQSFPDVFIPDGYVDVLRTQFIIEQNLMHGDRMIGYVVPNGVDIDAMKDLEFLDYYIQGHQSALFDYLNANYNPLNSIDQ
jgi:CMP-N-acetylneuraminic acid synthetase